MPTLFFYLVKLSAIFAVLWLFYYTVLRPLTFYNWNRWYLLGYSLLSFLIPLIDIGSFVTASTPDHQPAYFAYIPALGNYSPALAPPAIAQNAGVDRWAIALLILSAGIILLLARTLIRWYSLMRIRARARVISDKEIRIYQVDGNITPFSFGKAIYINPQLHTEKEWEEIILHEYVHIRQRHTTDILLAELICILNWYNPFTWALRHSIRQNLEFIADQKVLDNGVDKKDYQYHLLKVVGHPQYRLANNFNFSSLKKRIIMMNKMRSARLHLLRFLFLLPLLTVVLLAFRSRYPEILGHKSAAVRINAAGIVISLPGKTPLQGVTVREKSTGLQTITDANGFYKLRIPVTGDSISIHLEYTKQGYEGNQSGRFLPSVKQITGIIDVAFLEPPATKLDGFFGIAPNFYSGKAPSDPGYEDALAELHRVLSENDQLNRFMTLEKAHPEIGLFYVGESKQKGLIIHLDGSVEKYGYPGSPSFAEMDKKYGPLPWFMIDNAHPVGQGYLDRWAAISAQAEKEFHPTGGNPKAIIFPGDSRVIAVPATGKPQIYDMDNTADPKERPAFEQLYGPLPACVPTNGTVPAIPTRTISQSQPSAKPVTAAKTANPADTIPGKDQRHATLRVSLDSAHFDATKAAWMVNGMIKKDWTMDSLPKTDIASIDITSPEEGARLFGDRGKNGLITVWMRSKDATPLPTDFVQTAMPKPAPIYVVDGIRFPDHVGGLGLITPNEIQSIKVLKNQADTAVYGPEAAVRGVVLVTTKNPQKKP